MAQLVLFELPMFAARSLGKNKRLINKTPMVNELWPDLNKGANVLEPRVNYVFDL